MGLHICAVVQRGSGPPASTSRSSTTALSPVPVTGLELTDCPGPGPRARLRVSAGRGSPPARPPTSTAGPAENQRTQTGDLILYAGLAARSGRTSRMSHSCASRMADLDTMRAGPPAAPSQRPLALPPPTSKRAWAGDPRRPVAETPATLTDARVPAATLRTVTRRVVLLGKNSSLRPSDKLPRPAPRMRTPRRPAPSAAQHAAGAVIRRGPDALAGAAAVPSSARRRRRSASTRPGARWR